MTLPPTQHYCDSCGRYLDIHVYCDKCLDEVESFAYDPDYGDRPRLRLVGKKGKREVVVEVFFEPFEGDEPTTVFDVNAGGWRNRRSDAE